MSVPAFQTTVVNASGEILTAAIMTIVVEATGSPAVLWSDRDGTIPLGIGGVFPVDGTTAFAQFYAAPGNYRVTANDAGSGFSETWRYVVLAGSAAEADIGLLTGNVPTADDLSMVGETVNYTGANYQPDIVDGLGSKTRLYNLSGGNIAAGATVSGTLLKTFQADGSGTVTTKAFMSGTYENTTGGIINNERSADFTKVSN